MNVDPVVMKLSVLIKSDNWPRTLQKTNPLENPLSGTKPLRYYASLQTFGSKILASDNSWDSYKDSSVNQL